MHADKQEHIHVITLKNLFYPTVGGREKSFFTSLKEGFTDIF